MVTMCLIFFKIYKRSLWRARSVALCKHATHYGPWSGFLYYNLTTPKSLKNQPNMSDKKLHNVSYTYKNRNYKGHTVKHYKGLTEEEKQMLNRSLKTWKLQRTNTGKHYISIFILSPGRDFNTYWSFVWHTWSWCRLLIIWYRHIFSWSVIWIRMHWFHVTESRRLQHINNILYQLPLYMTKWFLFEFSNIIQFD